MQLFVVSSILRSKSSSTKGGKWHNIWLNFLPTQLRKALLLSNVITRLRYALSLAMRCEMRRKKKRKRISIICTLPASGGYYGHPGEKEEGRTRPILPRCRRGSIQVFVCPVYLTVKTRQRDNFTSKSFSVTSEVAQVLPRGEATNTGRGGVCVPSWRGRQVSGVVAGKGMGMSLIQ